ncbi:hypothetical protein FSP39_007060 [Pinctada imbricata]|uniref:Uncharacterized protein n=1 Tax=Pinctada imbricata TaxID=66713 RepID=A0AA88YBN0_PINIB|nr:hypothetical protein FSP39_007060 [Pinctada imbricata]
MYVLTGTRLVTTPVPPTTTTTTTTTTTSIPSTRGNKDDDGDDTTEVERCTKLCVVLVICFTVMFVALIVTISIFIYRWYQPSPLPPIRPYSGKTQPMPSPVEPTSLRPLSPPPSYKESTNDGNIEKKTRKEEKKVNPHIK